ncbi:MAG: ATP-dependent RNA helicase HrpA [Pirellulaceae bacterium]
MSPESSYHSQIDRCMLKDRFRLRKMVRQLSERHKSQQPANGLAQKLEEAIQRSVELRQQRLETQPKINYPAELPVSEHREEIIRAIQANQVVVVAGETGSGKSTQLPKLCLEAGFGTSAMIGHTQPRRIAARSVADRVAEELGCSLGQEVGFKIRFTDKSSDRTLIKVMTDGILLAETQTDRFLENYDAIILDEAHERSLNIDFLLAFLHQTLQRRRDLRLIITSATLDAERFAAHFGNESGPAPVIQVSGRTYPVDVQYRPLQEDERGETDVYTGIVAAVDELSRIGSGDVLVFLPTERDIREATKRLRSSHVANQANTLILPLYARLSAAEQNKIFQTGKHRRIVLATNVAESSLTVPGIRYVVDSGTARISRYSPKVKVQRLPIEAVSKASADQRKGRCGRLGPGVCIRLYSAEDYDARDRYTTPEIRRTNLASVILQAKALRLGEIESIPFLDPPRPDAIRDGYKTLFEIGALDAKRELTDIGRRLARLPVDPRVGRMVLAADSNGCLAEVLIIAAALEIQDPRERPLEKQQAADQAQQKFQDERSDFISYLKLWDMYHHWKESLSKSQVKKACQQNFLSVNRMYEWTEIHRQLKELAKANGLKQSARKDDYNLIHQSLLSGLLSGVALRTSDFEYTGAGGVKFHLWPGSGVFSKKPKWIFAAELLETTRRYGRNVAVIQPEWLEPIAAHLIKRSCSDPHWSSKAASAMAYEKLSLFGLPVVPKRRIRYRQIDPEESRRLFIQHGLVENQIHTNAKWHQQNQQVIAEIAELAAKTRKREYLLDEYTLFAAYDRKLPETVCDLADLNRWLKKSAANRQQFPFTVDDLVHSHATDLDHQQFPELLRIGQMELPVKYNFQPGADEDGVTVSVPVEVVNQVSEADLEWLVPGLVEEKVLALIRSLPKPIRRNLVPAPDTAKKVADSLVYGQGDFMQEVCQRLGKIAEEPIRPSDFQSDKIPRHLRIHIEVLGHDGQKHAAGRELPNLRQELKQADIKSNVAVSLDHWDRVDIVTWDFGDIPESEQLLRHGIPITVYPGLQDGNEACRQVVFDSAVRREHETRLALTKLFSHAHRKSLKTQLRWLPEWERFSLFASSLMPADVLKDEIRELIARRAFLDSQPLPLTHADWERFQRNAVERIAMATQDVSAVLPKLFSAYHEARLAVEQIQSGRFAASTADVERQLAELVRPRFLVTTPWEWLAELPRYFQGIVYRIDKLTSGGHAKDERLIGDVQGFFERWDQRHTRDAELQRISPKLSEFRWTLEEFRVSLFAQPLGTKIKVSPQRLEKLWSEVEAES